MDWLKGMNQAAAYIEGNLTGRPDYGTMARMVGCSVFEFSKIFSFMTGMPVSEYIRRRRLSQAVFDLQAGERVIDVALKYGYDSPTAFARAFRELHGLPPSGARVPGASVKTYPPISFQFTIQGVSAMEFRMEKMDSFQIVGLSGEESPECENGETLTPLWRRFMEDYNPELYSGGGPGCLYSKPLCQVAAYSFQTQGGKMHAIIGAQYRGICPEGMDLEEVPAAEWAVFSFQGPPGYPHVPKAYTRILTEWFPQSGYRRDEAAPNLEVYPAGDANSPEYTWEIWMPVKK